MEADKETYGGKFHRGVAVRKFLAGGESRHWLYDASPIKENEDIHGREHNISGIYSSDIIRGGFEVDEDISGECKQNRGGAVKKALLPVTFDDENISRKSSHDTEVQRRSENDARNARGGFDNIEILKSHRPYILESFFYADEDTERLIPFFGDFLLDSGAFTFMENSNARLKWEEYIEKYADFIVRNNVRSFFELDIDSIVGYEEVKKLRRRLENLTGRQCIPVWHKDRKAIEFERLCDEYPRVAIGGIVSREIRPEHYDIFTPLIKKAHKRGAEVHGLGFTNLEGLKKYHFDSVDSTAWTTGNRFGFIYKFDGKTVRKIDVPKGKRLADSRKVALNNYIEWIQFQKYAETHL